MAGGGIVSSPAVRGHIPDYMYTTPETPDRGGNRSTICGRGLCPPQNKSTSEFRMLMAEEYFPGVKAQANGTEIEIGNITADLSFVTSPGDPFDSRWISDALFSEANRDISLWLQRATHAVSAGDRGSEIRCRSSAGRPAQVMSC